MVSESNQFGADEVRPVRLTLGSRYPKVSVIVPVFNGHELIQGFCRAIERSTYPNVELIVVDDFSNPAIALPDCQVTARLVRNQRNLGKAGSVNRGADYASGSILVISDPDVEPDPSLFERWASAFEGDNRLGVVGAYVYYAADRIRLTHAGAVMTQYLRTLPRRLVNQIDTGYSLESVRCPNFIFDDIFAIRASLWRQLGGFDDTNFDTMYEDADLQLRASRAGFSLLLASNARAYHHQKPESSVVVSRRWARRTMTGFKLSALPRNRLLFLRKHRLSHGFGLWLQGLALLLFYGVLAAYGGRSPRLSAVGLVHVVSAVKAGLRQPIV
jgi:GT2 family glycosyltransferase